MENGSTVTCRWHFVLDNHRSTIPFSLSTTHHLPAVISILPFRVLAHAALKNSMKHASKSDKRDTMVETASVRQDCKKRPR
jgi:hypothetical protein